MTLVQVVEDTTMLVPGFEHHTWQCPDCSVLEQRMRFSRAKISAAAAAPKPVRTAGTARTAMNPSTPLQPVQPAPVETQSIPLEPAQAVPAQEGGATPVLAECQTNARLETLRKVQERAAAARGSAGEIERRAAFNRFWDNLLSDPSYERSALGSKS
jgi:hypothetical protein